MIYYAGIGSRETPEKIGLRMFGVAYDLAEMGGFCLRSGGARGADQYFEQGVGWEAESKKEIYIPWDGFKPTKGKPFVRRNGEDGAILANDDAFWEAEGLCKALWNGWMNWDGLKQGTRRLLTRNVFQMRGIGGPASSFVLYWMPRAGGGGTSHALRIAEAYEIPCRKIEETDTVKSVIDWIYDVTSDKS